MKLRIFAVSLGLILTSFIVFPSKILAFGNTSVYPAGWYSFMGTTAILPGLKTDQVNTVLAWPANSSASSVKNYLDTAQANGIQVILSVVQLSDSAIQGLSSIANHPALVGWYIADEPEEASYNANAYNAVHLISNKPTLIVHYDTGSFDRFTTDIQGIDFYPNSSLLPQSASYWKKCVDWAKSNNKECIIVPLGFGLSEAGQTQWNGVGDYNELQYRYHILSGVALGADGVYLWHCDPQDESNYNTNSRIKPLLTRTLQTINAVGPEMAATVKPNRGVNDSRVTISGATSSQLVYRYGTTANRQAILAVNLSSSNLNVTFNVAGAGNGTVNVVMEAGGSSRTLTMTNGSFTDTFIGYESHAYTIGGGSTLTPIPTTPLSLTPTPKLTNTTTPKVSITPGANTIYQAESTQNTLTGTARILDCAGCSGGSRVGYIGGSGNTLKINNIYIPADGNYSVDIVYTNGLTTNLEGGLSLNNSNSWYTFSFPSTGSFNITAIKTISFGFIQGSNTLVIGNNNADAPDIDYIVVHTNNQNPVGDANRDGLVNGFDYNIWQSNFGKNLIGTEYGNFNLDNYIDGFDYVIWLNSLSAN